MRGKRVSAVIGLAVMAALVAGCSSSSSDCDQRDQVRQDYEALVNTDVVAEGTDVLSQRFNTLQEDIQRLTNTAAGQEFGTEIAAVNASMSQVSTTIQGVKDAPGVEAAAQVVPALSNLKSSATALIDAVSSACG
jgi:uncharacterized protein YoxC